jgi:hypothetical protein
MRILSIGVTGHRFLSDIPKLQTGIDEALDWINRTYPDESWSMLSSLAEGADQLIVERILVRKPDANLIVPLPLEEPEYINDFTTPESREEFTHLFHLAGQVIPPLKLSPETGGYLAAGLYMLDHCDILIALWDGLTARGQGGTGDIVEEAGKRKIPVLWVFCANKTLGLDDPSDSKADQGEVLYELL